MTAPVRKRRLSPRGSKAKGSGYERELATWLNERMPALRTRRALLSGGGRSDGGADLDGTPRIHIEAKRTETFAPKAAMAQAEEAISRGDDKALMPVVINRTNRMPTDDSLVVMRLRDWAVMYERLLEQRMEQK